MLAKKTFSDKLYLAREVQCSKQLGLLTGDPGATGHDESQLKKFHGT
jgi:hypothetical protein